MLDSNIILGIRGNLGCEDYVHGILTQEWESWPCGTPIVYSSSATLNSGGSEQVMSLMTASQNSAGRETASTPVSIISPVDMRPLCGNHEVLPVSHFEIKKFDRLLEFVRDVGGISLIIEPPHGRKTAAKAVRQIGELFKYSSMFYYNAWGKKHLNGDNDRYVCVVTLLDLPYCVPLFNMRRVSGIGLSFSGATIDASRGYGILHRIFRTDIIYSNYEDNVFVIDGVNVNAINPMHSDHYKELVKMAGQDLPVQAKKSASKKEMSMHGELRGYGKHGYLDSNQMEWKTTKQEWDQTVQAVNVEVQHVEMGGKLVTNFPPTPADEAPDDAPEETEPEQATENIDVTEFGSGTGTFTLTTSSDGLYIDSSNDNIIWPEDEEPFSFQNEEGN